MNMNITGLVTDRLKLRALDSQDEEAVFVIYSDKETMKYWDSLPFSKLSQATEMILNVNQRVENGTSVCVGIEESSSNLLVGTLSLFNFHPESRRAEVGYVLNRSCWGNGYMTEVLIRVVNYCFTELHLNRLEADIDPDNIASANVLKKAGFLLEGKLRQRWIVDGNCTDSEFYGLVLSDWKKSSG